MNPLGKLTLVCTRTGEERQVEVLGVTPRCPNPSLDLRWSVSGVYVLRLRSNELLVIPKNRVRGRDPAPWSAKSPKRAWSIWWKASHRTVKEKKRLCPETYWLPDEEGCPARAGKKLCKYSSFSGLCVQCKRPRPNMLTLSDNLPELHELDETFHEKVMLAYLDPPFFTQKVHKTQAGEVAFEDKWNSLAEWLWTFERRLYTLRPLISREGSVVVHVNQRTSGHVRVMGDRIFGQECFASEIIWRYRHWPTRTQNFQAVHDTLLRWRKDASSEPRFHQLYEPLAPSTLKTWGTGRQLTVMGPNGKRLRSSTTAEKSPGAALGDVWDIGIIAPVSKERVDFPAQKPEALLERLILALTSEGDLVLDPYCGSGTTLVVAEKRKRLWIGIDKSEVAIRVARERLSRLGQDSAEDKRGTR